MSAHKLAPEDSDFVLEGIPEGREISSAWSVNQVGGALAALRLDNVQHAESIDWSDAVHYHLLTADGLVIDAQLKKADEDHWIRLEASHVVADSADQPEGRDQSAEQAQGDMSGDEGAASGSRADEAEAGEEGAADTESEDAADDESASDEEPKPSAAERAAEINARVAGWAYQIPGYKYDGMVKRMEDMLKALDESS